MPDWFANDPDGQELNFEYMKLPVFRQGMEVLDTVNTIAELVTDAAEQQEKIVLETVRIMLEDMQIVLAKIAGAEGADLYGLQIENAYIIKAHARNVQVSTNMLKMSDTVDASYIQLLRDQVDEFRKAYLDWVNGFDPTNDIKGEWDFH